MRRLLPALVLMTGCAHSHRPLPAPVAVVQSPSAPQKRWTDQAEYEVANAAAKENDPAAKLAYLDKWTAGYPATEYSDERQSMYMLAYQQLRQARQAFDMAQEILRTRPLEVDAISTTVTQVTLIRPAPTPADLDAAERNANLALEYPDLLRPPNVADEEWTKTKGQMKSVVESVLIAIYRVRKDDKRAVGDLTRLIRLDPTLASASYQLGQAMMRVIKMEGKPERQPLAFFHIARAVAYTGPNAVPPVQRPTLLEYLTKAYTAFHGSTEGLDQLLAMAKTSAFPPSNFKIQSTVDIIHQQARNN
jgi:tetratricopeptide (TPR) repeat protein